MMWEANSVIEQCSWNECENPGSTGESRISVARRVIQDVVRATQSEASFALMTFEQRPSPTSRPSRCNIDADGDGMLDRFLWTEWYGYFEWEEIDKYEGVQGAWRICQGNGQRPYPYLRWDDIGTTTLLLSNHMSGDLPSSPMLNRNPAAVANAGRGVQWFPQYLGTRIQLNDETDPDREVLNATFGDFGNNETERLDPLTGVWNQDFYYWPYVDGFTHYSDTSLFPFDALTLDRAGVVGENTAIDEARLYVPFFVDAELGGPQSRQEAVDEIIWKTSPLVEGGIDVGGRTPWASVIGDIPASPPDDNHAEAHTTVASYLAFLDSLEEGAVCVPTSLIVLTDGVPSPGEGGSTLYRRLSALREELGVRTYVVGFFADSSTQINEMACAAAGSCGGGCTNPCSGVPVENWDTCENPDTSDPSQDCAFLADSASSLASVLTSIVAQELDLNLSSGPPFTSNDYIEVSQTDTDVKQTIIAAGTDFPGWRGHVTRRYCSGDGEECQPPTPEFSPDDQEATFGPCPQSREWDAGACLQSMLWSERRLYSVDTSNTVYRISDDEGLATDAFIDALVDVGRISSASEDSDNDGLRDADEIVAFILGQGWPDDWKLPGLANSAPVVVHRIPPYQPAVTPSVNIRDPHCSGRRFPTGVALPRTLIDFARDAWDEEQLLSEPSPHYEYQEAVLVGDDLGILHAFQYNSGNELWGFLPPQVLLSTLAQFDEFQTNPANRGQPEALEDHHYGVAATINTGWVYDDANERWRHLGVVGLGEGGRDIIAFDLSHMSPASDELPIDVLWQLHGEDEQLGLTWGRPALTYHVPADSMDQEPSAFLVFGSGYPVTELEQGRRLATVNALTGEVLRSAYVDAPSEEQMIDEPENFGLVADPAVASQCLSGFWAEAQETYITDMAGRLFRWDLGRTTPYAADSGGTWPDGGMATEATALLACQGPSSACTVSSRVGEPFVYPPAVTSNDRIDDASGAVEAQRVDEYLIALISGSADDDAVDATTGDSNFHSSLYLLVDDHQGDPSAGFSVPVGSPKMSIADIGSNDRYLRLALSEIERTREVTPFPGADSIVETRRFLASTRPIRAPRILVRGVTVDNDGDLVAVEGNEVFEVTFTVYEPAAEECDARFYDPNTHTWFRDQGDTFQIVFRLTASSTGGFSFSNGSDDTGSYPTGFARGLTLQSVTQVTGSDGCTGNCGAVPEIAAPSPCEPRDSGLETYDVRSGVTLSSKQIVGFTPIEAP